MNLEFKPKFVKRYTELGRNIPDAVAAFKKEVAGGVFPAEENTFHADEPLFTPKVGPQPASEAANGEITELYGVPV
jgi:3-methyl-2-oxobutanoate hydroxymethyltransferase